MLTLILAPLSGVLAGICHCKPELTESEEMAPIPCCEGFERCCYEHSERHEAMPLVADLNQQNRAEFKVAARQLVQLLPSPAAEVALEQKSIHCADPPDSTDFDLSFRQSWLI